MKNLFLYLIITGCYICNTEAQSRKFNQILADSLSKWAIVDQTAAGFSSTQANKLSPEKWQQYKDSVFQTHGRLLGDILKRYGYPGYDLVGEKGSNCFWLMAQHCDYDPALQEKILAAMKPELAKHNADPKNFAYLTDRVRLNTGSKQVYGTQVTYRTDSCQAIPRALTDSLTVNTRRKEIGLEPIESYLNWMSQLHFDMNKSSYEQKGIHHPKLIPVPGS